MIGDMDDRQGTSAGLAATVAEDSSVPAVGAPAGFPAGTQVAGRFVVNSALGRGSSGEVLAVQDLSLDREVAMKVLRGAGGPAIARFMREARITARLDHPSVPPVHTLEFLPDGGLLFTMRRLDGMTLGEAVRRSSAGETLPALASTNATVSLGLRICEALSRAHFLGIIHRDVKPDNIMLGAHGEVALVDWGECRLLDQTDTGPAGSTVGTPAYMSPEQARGEPADQRSDIYALGATLWHALTRRHPTWDADPARFWEKKRAGVIDPLPADASARVPRQLLAILQRALVAAPEGRYATVADLAADLERFQAGQAVAAYREGAFERLLRWQQRHRRAILAVGAMLAVCLTAGALLWREHQRTLADWGPPIHSEDFADESWRNNWFEEQPGLWTLQDGRIVGNGEARSALVFDRVLAGAVAIEYEGEMLPGAKAGDLSIVWTEDPDIAPGRWVAGGRRGFMVQAGAYDNYFCAVYRWPGGARLDQRPFRLKHGVRYRFRVELDGSRIGMWIDGERILEAEADLPITSGHLSFYAWYPGKAFDNVRVYQKRLPQVTSVLAIGEAFQRERQPVQAAAAFREVAESHPGTELADEARYREGLALRQSGDLPAAILAWRKLPPGRQAERVAGHLLDLEMDKGRVTEACTAFTEQYRRSPEVRSQLRAQWQAWAMTSFENGLAVHDRAAATALTEVKLQLFPDHSGSDFECGLLLNALCRFREVIERYPNDVTTCGPALIRLGRSGVVLERFSDSRSLVFSARLALGRIGDVLEDKDSETMFRVIALVMAGRLDEAAALDPEMPMVLLRQGRAEDVLRTKANPEGRAAALAHLGRWEEALAIPNERKQEVQHLSGRFDPRAHPEMPYAGIPACRLVGLCTLGETGMRDRLAATMDRLWPDWDDWITQVLVLPICRGNTTMLRAQLELAWRDGRQGASQRAYHLAGFTLGRLGADCFARAPCAGEAVLWRSVGDALRAELAGDREGIRHAWRAYLALPWSSRLPSDILPDPRLECLAQWRAGSEGPP